MYHTYKSKVEGSVTADEHFKETSFFILSLFFLVEAYGALVYYYYWALK